MSGTGTWAGLLDYTWRETGRKEGSTYKEQKYRPFALRLAFAANDPGRPPGGTLTYGGHNGYNDYDSHEKYHSHNGYNKHHGHQGHKC